MLIYYILTFILGVISGMSFLTITACVFVAGEKTKEEESNQNHTHQENNL